MRELDGRWIIDSVRLRNKFNGNTLELSASEWERVEKGESVSLIYHEQIKRTTTPDPSSPYFDFGRDTNKWHS